MLLPCISLFVSATLASVGVEPAGWLDRLVEYHRQKFLQDFNEVAPIKIKATIIPRPPGYVDSHLWDYESVLRLLSLVRQSEDAAPVRVALRRALTPTRRFMSRAESFKHFPSLGKYGPDETYYSIESDEEYIQRDLFKVLDEDAVITISNPVEARLPSARISVGLLKQIMEQRAMAARIMPTTTRQRRSRMTKLTSPTVHSETTMESGSSNSDNTTDGGAAAPNITAEADSTPAAETEAPPAE